MSQLSDCLRTHTFSPLVGCLADERVRQASAGSVHSAVVTEAGEMFTMGYNGEGRLGLASNALKVDGSPNAPEHRCKREPTLVEALRWTTEAPVVEVAAGLDHALARTADGRIFSWGSNAHGQTGLGGQWRSLERPLEIEVPFRRALGTFEAQLDAEA